MEVHLSESFTSLEGTKPQEIIHGRSMTEHVVARTVSLYFSLCVCSKPRRLGSSFGPQSRGQEGVSQVPQTLHLVCPGKNCWEVDPLLNTEVTRNPRDSLYYHWESNTFKKKTFIMKLIYRSYLCRYSFAIKITFTSNSLWDVDYTFLHCSRLLVDQSFPLERLHCSRQTGSCQLLDPLSPSTRMCFQTHYMLDTTPCRMSLKDSFL